MMIGLEEENNLTCGTTSASDLVDALATIPSVSILSSKTVFDFSGSDVSDLMTILPSGTLNLSSGDTALPEASSELTPSVPGTPLHENSISKVEERAAIYPSVYLQPLPCEF